MDQSLGNLEGKELRFGTRPVPPSRPSHGRNLWLGQLHARQPQPARWPVPLLRSVDQLRLRRERCRPDQYADLRHCAVFLAGLLVGRTPEYLGKKVEVRELKLAVLALLVHPILILSRRRACLLPSVGSPVRPAIRVPMAFRKSSMSLARLPPTTALPSRVWVTPGVPTTTRTPHRTAVTGTLSPAWSCCSDDSCRSSLRLLSRPASCESQHHSPLVLCEPTRSPSGSFFWEPSFWWAARLFMPAAMLGSRRGTLGAYSLRSANY